MNDADSGLPKRQGRVALRPGELPRAAPQSRRIDGGGAPWIAVVARRPELIPGVAALAVFWATAQGGVMATDSYPGALFLLGVLSATLYASGRACPVSPFCRSPRSPCSARLRSGTISRSPGPTTRVPPGTARIAACCI